MKWEYLLARINGTEDISQLTRLGEEGWEAFAAVGIQNDGGRTGGSVVFLKRPRGPDGLPPLDSWQPTR